MGHFFAPMPSLQSAAWTLSQQVHIGQMSWIAVFEAPHVHGVRKPFLAEKLPECISAGGGGR